MPGGTRTLTVTPGFEVTREALTFTTRVEFENTGLFTLFNRSERPTYKFSLELPALQRIAAQSLSGFHHFHQGGKAFFYDGGLWDSVTSLNLVGEGDGTRTDFFLPNRFVDSNSISVAVFDGTTTSITTAFSLNPDPGVIVFDTAPASADDIMASHSHKYRVVFEPDGLKMVQFAKGVWRAKLDLRETII